MRIVLFDLGNTLVDENTLTLIPGANETLSDITKLRDSEAEPFVIALVSDYGKLNSSHDDIEMSLLQGIFCNGRQKAY
jgi:hypothetical protein